MIFGSYTVTCCFDSAACLSSFKGSALRGAFGHALKKTCCAQRFQDCQKCLLSGSCAYSYIFETQKNQAESRSRLSSRPHPYVLYPEDRGLSLFQKGDQFRFKLLLFGERAVNMLAYIVFAITLMGREGLGKGSRSGAGRFSLVSVNHEGVDIYNGDKEEFMPPRNFKSLQLKQEITPCYELQVDFLTPLRMKNKQTFVREMDFQTLIRGALRRVSALEEFYGAGYPDLDYKGFIDGAAEVSGDLSQTCWQEQTRYSNRQKQKMNMGGITGRAIYKGDIGKFLPILRYCEATHMGKQTAFGLGRIRLEPV